MGTLKRIWASGKWIFLVVLAAGLTVLGFVLRGLFHSPGDSGGAALPEVPKPLQEAVRKAEEEALVTKAKVKVQTEAQKAELEAIMEVDDGVERRKRLAEMMNRL